MLKLKRYLKPFILGLIAALVLLFVQAICELNLPNLMSDIVNIGIQQGGIESSAPDAISVDGYEFITSFVTDDELEIIEDNYTLYSDGEYSDEYPEVAEVYVLNEDVSSADAGELDDIFSTATWTMIYTVQSISDDVSTDNFTSIDVTALYEITPFISYISDEDIASYKAQAEGLDEYILNQSGIIMVESYYTELGLDMDSYQINYIFKIGALMLLVVLIAGVATILANYFSSRIAAGVARKLRSDVFSKIMTFSHTELDKFSTASLITRTTNDITQIQTVLMMGIRMICFSPMMAIGALIMAINKSVSMVWVFVAAIIAILGVITVIFICVLPRFKILQKLVDRINLVTREALTGLMVIKAFGTSNFEKKRFEKANKDFAKTNLFINRMTNILTPAMTLVMNGTYLLIIWVGAEQIANSSLQVGDMMAFMQYAAHVIMSFLMISMMFIFIPRASVSAIRINEILTSEPAIKDPEKAENIKGENTGIVEFKNVSFKYDGADEYMLKNINFKTAPGKTTAFIGATGSGKTTLVNMIPRFYDVTEGKVIVDGVNVKDMTQHELRSHIGYVPQKSVLMSGTIESNIKYGEGVDDEMMAKAAEISQSMEFIDSKDDKFDSHIAQGGANVSGGQRQRLSIARALAVNPDIYIFDDSFSALDFKTDATLRKALSKNIDDATVIIVAQRVSTIMNADQIFVLDDGNIVGGGTHKELLKTCPEYYEIASSQLSKEELENE